MDDDRHLGRSPLIRMRAQLVADHLFPSAHGGFDPGALIVSRPPLPSHAAVFGDVLEVAVALCHDLAGSCVHAQVKRPPRRWCTPLTEGEMTPVSVRSCGGWLETNGVRASGCQHPVQDRHAHGGLRLLGSEATCS